MTVKISGVLKDGTGKPVQNCTIVLKARRTSSTVVVNTVASENPDEAGRYSMDVEYGQYSVTLLVEGFPPSHAGTITVYEGSRPGTLNDFLGAMTEDDARPEALRRFELMVNEVARHAGASSQSAAAAKKSETAAASSKNVKDDATGWIFFEATLKADTTENTVGGFVQYSPDTGQMVASGDYLDVTTPQIEAGTGASSFIVTGTAPVTRASDMVTVPIKNNLYNLPFTVLCEVHKNWYKTPNAAPRVFDTYRHQADAGIVMGFGSSGGYDGFPYCDIGGSNRRINENAGLEKMLIGMRVKSERSTCVVSNGKLSSETKTKWEYIRSTATIRIGGQTTAGLRHLFGHVRNFRLWHKELTDAQLGEVVE
ncbi:hypothetical protein FHA54_08235 [Escherichia coli]|uniref:prophage tail fiber N-terminal domain-containing protein n=1 Tax=Escherichia coli TaxID=562 RepID=UPI001C707EEA|nr:prophage tail fiber N-terminal domain-containing protein [Escherichia coli]MBW9496828.1 hypothetical protein [Escherichia coli]MBW9536855.1 hypothetical protein [Escherichia coli]